MWLHLYTWFFQIFSYHWWHAYTRVTQILDFWGRWQYWGVKMKWNIRILVAILTYTEYTHEYTFSAMIPSMWLSKTYSKTYSFLSYNGLKYLTGVRFPHHHITNELSHQKAELRIKLTAPAGLTTIGASSYFAIALTILWICHLQPTSQHVTY